MNISNPWRAMPYLIRDSFNATSGLIFAAMIIIMFVSSSSGGIPEWVGNALKLSALLFIIIDVIVRKFTFKINIDNDSFSYTCRGVIDSHKCRFKLQDIEAIDVRRQWHYRALGLSVLDISTIGSSDSVIKNIVLRRKDAEQLGVTARGAPSFINDHIVPQDEGSSQNYIFQLSALRVIVTPWLTPWRRSIGEANSLIMFPVALFFISMLATNGNIDESIDATMEAASAQTSAADQGVLEELLSTDFGAQLDFRNAFDSMSVAITVFFLTFIVLGRFTVNSLRRVNYRVCRDGDSFVVESGVFDIHKYQFKVSQFSSYEFDNNWLYRYFGYTRLRIFNRDDGSAYASPLINKKEMELILLSCDLPIHSSCKFKVPYSSYVGRVQKATGVLCDTVLSIALFYVCLPYIYKDGSEVVLTHVDSSFGTGCIVLIPLVVFFIYAILPTIYNFLYMKARCDNGIYTVYAWDENPIIAVFSESEIFSTQEEGVAYGCIVSCYPGKKEYSFFKSVEQ
jgi:hypothetical protein